MITIPLLIVIATVLSAIPMTIYHLNLPFKMKTDALVSYTIGVWSTATVAAVFTVI